MTEAAKKRPSIGAYVYTFNEEANIAACLESVSWCDELVVVDANSTDRTREIAARMGARVIQHDWEGFRQQAQFALEQVRSDWALSLDADERVTPELRAEIEQAITTAPEDVGGFRLPRVTRHLGTYFRHGTLFKMAPRLARTGRCRWVGDNPHCHLEIDGRVLDLRGELLHLRDRNLASALSVYNEYSSQKAAEMWARGRRANAWTIFWRAAGRFLRSFLIKGGFRHGTAGLVAAMEEATYNFYKYAKLWELSLGARDAGSPANRRKPAETQAH
ncbi:MAG: glycosyltransferase family 2 protein [Candidatus Dadabacteria bacterium]|nr:MAG: glycosyltransferase family 2 protein [Candidatus Dadabacteria bacterium]